YDIAVLNEREIRAAAGILFVLMLVAILTVIFKEDFSLLKYAVSIFLADILIRVLINPKFSPSLIIGRLIVRRQTPEYVGAQQKKVAWIIGTVLAGIMFLLIILFNSYSIITGLICLICLIFLFFESAFGICIGCVFYGWIYRGKAQYCPGEVCDVKNKQDIQKTSWAQIFIVLGFIAFIVGMVFYFNDTFHEAPGDLWEILDEMF
ncbi:MAG: DUF4395 domain-containing protein, partial [Bacteroidetes bacterium]|nr:DUF4395 domain-containing protein [Bacteroidota bacterium]